MNGQPMPEAIKDLLVQDPQVSDAGKKDHFVRDFDIKPNIILYHTHVESKQQKQKQKASVKNYEPKFHGKGRHGWIEQTIKKGLKQIHISNILYWEKGSSVFKVNIFCRRAIDVSKNFCWSLWPFLFNRCIFMVVLFLFLLHLFLGLAEFL